MKFFFFSLISIVFYFSAHAQKIELEGRYLGKNIFVLNPSVDTGKHFCTDSITINGKKASFKNESSYTIYLDSAHLNHSDSVRIVIYHKTGCKPSVLNDNSTPKSSLQIVTISIDSTGTLHWVTKNEQYKLPFIVEQFKWNRWINMGTVEGKGINAENVYDFKTDPHSGKNEFRIKQVDLSRKATVSGAVYYQSSREKVTFNGGYISEKVIFSSETNYVIYDQWGDAVLKGKSKEVNCKKLAKGAYYINYDNSMAEFIKP